MRIISGKFGGTVLNTHLRPSANPMAEKLRSGLFSALGDIEGLAILDGFAGSGSVGLEALSRGAASAQFVESDSKNFRVLEDNIRITRTTEQAKATMAGLGDWLETIDNEQFDLVLLDPPFNRIPWQAVLGAADLVANSGVLGINMPKTAWPLFGSDYLPKLEQSGFNLARTLKSGEARYALLKRSAISATDS